LFLLAHRSEWLTFSLSTLRFCFFAVDTSAFKSVKKLIGIADEEDPAKTLVDPYVTFT